MAVGSIQVGNMKKDCRMVVRTQTFPYNVSSNTAFSCAGNSYAEYILLSLEQNQVF